MKSKLKEDVKIRCPEHKKNGLTPKDVFCHDHVSDTQQLIHNLHCDALQCPRALKGVERHQNVAVQVPRNRVEALLLAADPITKRVLKVLQ